MTELRPGWYRKGDEPERFHDGVTFTDLTRPAGGKTDDGMPLFVWEDGGSVRGHSAYGTALDTYRNAGWQQVTMHRFDRVMMILVALACIGFGVFLYLS